MDHGVPWVSGEHVLGACLPVGKRPGETRRNRLNVDDDLGEGSPGEAGPWGEEGEKDPEKDRF